MAYVITSNCERAGLCVDACPTDSIHFVDDDPEWPTYYIDPETCIDCAACEVECPNQAFDADTGLSDPLKCIECMHCVYICPDQVLKVDDRMEGVYSAFLENWHLTEEMMGEKRSKIITEAWQAAF